MSSAISRTMPSPRPEMRSARAVVQSSTSGTRLVLATADDRDRRLVASLRTVSRTGWGDPCSNAFVTSSLVASMRSVTASSGHAAPRAPGARSVAGGAHVRHMRFEFHRRPRTRTHAAKPTPAPVVARCYSTRGRRRLPGTSSAPCAGRQRTLGGVHRRLRPVVDTELREDASHVRLHGVDREEQLLADLGVGAAEREQRQHLLFAR